MAIISSNIGDNDFPLRKKELRLVDAKTIPEEKRVKNITDKIKRNQAITVLKDRKVAVAKKEWLAKLKDQAYIEYIK